MFNSIICFFKGHNFSSQRNVYIYSALFHKGGNLDWDGLKTEVTEQKKLVEICSCCGEYGKVLETGPVKAMKSVPAPILRGVLRNLRYWGIAYIVEYAIHAKPQPTVEEQRENARKLIHDAFKAA